MVLIPIIPSLAFSHVSFISRQALSMWKQYSHWQPKVLQTRILRKGEAWVGSCAPPWPVTLEWNEAYSRGEWVFPKGKDSRQTMTSSLSRLISLSLFWSCQDLYWMVPSRGGEHVPTWLWSAGQREVPARSLLQACRLEQLLHQVGVGQPPRVRACSNPM